MGRSAVPAVRRQLRSFQLPPLIMRWQELPVLLLRSGKTPAPLQDAPPWLVTGPAEQGFDFCSHVRRLLGDIVARCPALGHVDVSTILLGVTRARNRRSQGLQARVTPLRFANGSLFRRRHGTTYQVQRYFLRDHEFLYLMTFCLPRFLDQDFADKFITVFHELYHLHPAGNGDLRRHAGRCQLHSSSQRAYDRQMTELARAYLATKPDPDLHACLRLDFAQLQKRHGAIAGIVVPRPRSFPVTLLPRPSQSSIPQAAAVFQARKN